MNKKETKQLKSDFYTLIDKNPKTKDEELANDLKVFNKSFSKEDFFIQNLFEDVGRFFTKNLKTKMKSYVNDIIEDYNNSEKNQKKIEESLIYLVNKYGPNDKTFLDRVLNILGIS